MTSLKQENVDSDEDRPAHTDNSSAAAIWRRREGQHVDLTDAVDAASYIKDEHFSVDFASSQHAVPLAVHWIYCTHANCSLSDRSSRVGLLRFALPYEFLICDTIVYNVVVISFRVTDNNQAYTSSLSIILRPYSSFAYTFPWIWHHVTFIQRSSASSPSKCVKRLLQWEHRAT